MSNKFGGLEQGAYEVIQKTQPTMLKAIGLLLKQNQTPKQIADFTERKGNKKLAGLVEMAATYMKENNLTE